MLTEAAPLAPAPRETDVLDHLEWADRLARKVAKAYRFRPCSSEEDELIGEARVELCRQWSRFDFERGVAFRGFARQSIVTLCRREARRLRNGGTYHTRRETPGFMLIVDPRSEYLNADGEMIEPENHRTHPAERALDLDPAGLSQPEASPADLMAMLVGGRGKAKRPRGSAIRAASVG